MLQELLTDNPESVALARARCARRSAPAASPARSTPCCPAPASAGSTPTTCVALGRAEEVPEFVAAGLFLRAVPRRPRRPVRHRLPRPDRRARSSRPRCTATSCGPGSATSSSTSTRTPTPARSRCSGRSPATAATCRSSATPTSRSTASAAPRSAASSTSRPSSRPPTARPAPVVALGTTRRFGSRLLRASRSDRRLASRVTGSHPGASVRRVPRARARRQRRSGRGRSRCSPSTPPAPRPSTSPTCSAAPTSRTASAGPRWRCWSAPAAPRSRRCAGRSAPPASRSRWPRRDPAGPRARGAAAARRARASSSTPAIDDPHHDDYVGADRAEALLTSPLGGLDATDVRVPHPGAAAPATGPTPARDLVRRARARRRRRSTGLDGEPARRARRLAAPARRGPRRRSPTAAPSRRCSGRSGTAPTGAPAAARPPRRGGPGRPPRPPRPRRGLRAVRERRPRRGAAGHTSVATFLATLRAQEIPADTLADRGVRGEAVRLLTAHRSKGLEWRLVVVAHVQEGAWPDLRRRATLLQADRIGRDGLRAAADPRARCSPRSAGCSTSPAPAPAQRLVVTAVAVARRRRRAALALPRTSSARDGRRTASGRPRRPLSLAGLVAELRRTARRPRRSPSRCATPPPAGWPAAGRRPTSHGRPVAAGADPATWWGLREPSRVRAAGAPGRRAARRSRPAPSRGCSTCPAQWFLEREAGGEVVSSSQARASARSCTRSPTGSPTASSTDRRRRPDGAGRRGLGPAGVPHAVVARPRARGGRARRSTRFVAWHQPPGRAHRARHRAGAPRRGDAARRPGGPAARVRRPARARRGRPGRGRRPQDRQVPAHRTRRRRAPPARPLPARRRPRRRRRARRADRSAPAAPSWSSCARRRRDAQGAGRSRRSAGGRGPAPGRGAADAGRGRRSAPRSSWPAPGSTASAARSRRSAPTRPPGRCCRDATRSTPPSSCADAARRGLDVQRRSSGPRSPPRSSRPSSSPAPARARPP